MDRAAISYPAVVAMDLAMAAWWRSVGVEPAAVVGYSIGEIAAAAVAGVLELPEAMRIVCAQGRLIDRLSGQGRMALVGLPWDETERVLGARAGAGRPRDRRQRGRDGRLRRAGRGGGAPGRAAGAGHRLPAGEHRRAGAQPAPGLDRGGAGGGLAWLRPRAARLPLYSEVTGGEVDGRTLDAAHWVQNLCAPVSFSAAVDAAIGRGHRLFLDVGPHPITVRSIEETCGGRARRGWCWRRCAATARSGTSCRGRSPRCTPGARRSAGIGSIRQVRRSGVRVRRSGVRVRRSGVRD